MKRYLVLACLALSLPAMAAKFTNESEVGVASATGNARTQNFNFKQLNDYKLDDTNILSLKARYLNAHANGVETARYFQGGLRYEKQVSSRFGFFTGETLEKDKFANIDQRLLFDLGGKYRFIETDETKFFGEAGYRYMDERRLDETEKFSNLGRVYSEWEHKWNSNYSTKLWAEYLPNFTDQKDWLFNTEASLSAALNQIFALKIGVLYRYDHFPAPGVIYKEDTLFTTALVAKF